MKKDKCVFIEYGENHFHDKCVLRVYGMFDLKHLYIIIIMAHLNSLIKYLLAVQK
jgi:hypothetical protein